MRDTVIEIEGGYRVAINWPVYAIARVYSGDEMIASKDYVMTTWHLPGPFSIHARIERWAKKMIRRDARLRLRLNGALMIQSSWKS